MSGKRRGSISEDDLASLLHRYQPTTILTLLQEVAQHAKAKIDWKEMVKRTTTGINSPREYQMLWRHLAYRHALLEHVNSITDPLDDDSDIEFELEAVPAPTGEVLSEASTIVKVLFSLGSSGELARGGADGPFRATSSDQIRRVLSDKQLARNFHGTGVASPILDQKPLVQSKAPAEAADGAGPPKKRRKPWTKDEDSQLTAAVQKYGEGNWIDMLKGDFKHDRTPAQMAQRWNVIRKRDGSLNHNGKSTIAPNSEDWMATQMALSIAIGPKSSSLSAIRPGGVQAAPKTEGNFTYAIKPVLKQISDQALLKTPVTKARSVLAKQTSVPNMFVSQPSSSIQAAAFAAGGRIATPSAAASLMKAIQSKNAVHIKSQGATLSKPSHPAAAAAAAGAWTGAVTQRAELPTNATVGGPDSKGQPNHDTIGKRAHESAEACSSRDKSERDSETEIVDIINKDLLSDVEKDTGADSEETVMEVVHPKTVVTKKGDSGDSRQASKRCRRKSDDAIEDGTMARAHGTLMQKAVACSSTNASSSSNAANDAGCVPNQTVDSKPSAPI